MGCIAPFAACGGQRSDSKINNSTLYLHKEFDSKLCYFYTTFWRLSVPKETKHPKSPRKRSGTSRRSLFLLRGNEKTNCHLSVRSRCLLLSHRHYMPASTRSLETVTKKRAAPTPAPIPVPHPQPLAILRSVHLHVQEVGRHEELQSHLGGQGELRQSLLAVGMAQLVVEILAHLLQDRAADLGKFDFVRLQLAESPR